MVEDSRKYLRWIVISSAVLLGFILLVSGTGKVPGQTEFIDALLDSFWTPPVAYFAGYVLPWLEVVMGAALMMGVLARLCALACVPLVAAFIANNAWAINYGVENFPQCSYCFGIWEDFLGTLSPLAALIIDIVLLALALVVVFASRDSFFRVRPWFLKR